MNIDNSRHYKVSILVPVYGVEKFIYKCAQSLFEQTYNNIEYIFVDDCTSDNSISILKNTLQNYPKRVAGTRIVKHLTNRGLAAARNTAIDAARGDFVLFIDSDDWIDKDFVEKLICSQIEGNYDVVTAACLEHKLNGNNVILPKDLSPQDNCLEILSRSQSSVIWGRLIKKNIFTENKLFCIEGANMGEDLQQTPRIFYHARSCAIQPETRYHYNRLNESSYTQGRSLKMDYQMWKSFDSLRDYFKDKGELYLEAWRRGEAKMIGWSLKHLNKVDDIDGYYHYLMDRWKTLPFRYVKYMDRNGKLAVMIHNKNLICELLNMYDYLNSKNLITPQTGGV